MATKTTGADLKRFWNDKASWPEGMYWDDGAILVNGSDSDNIDLSTVDNEAEISIHDGIVLHESDTDWNKTAPTLEAHFLNWQKKQTTRILLVEVPIERLEAVKTAMTAAGGQIFE